MTRAGLLAARAAGSSAGPTAAALPCGPRHSGRRRGPAARDKRPPPAPTADYTPEVPGQMPRGAACFCRASLYERRIPGRPRCIVEVWRPAAR